MSSERKKLRPAIPTVAFTRWLEKEDEELAESRYVRDEIRRDIAAHDEGDYWDAKLRAKGIVFDPEPDPNEPRISRIR